MNLKSLTCSRELAQRMTELGICQDRAELFYYIPTQSYKWKLAVLRDLRHRKPNNRGIVAPTLPRMTNELPNQWSVGYEHLEDGTRVAMVLNDKGDVVSDGSDDEVGNAVAKALIAIAERKA